MTRRHTGKCAALVWQFMRVSRAHPMNGMNDWSTYDEHKERGRMGVDWCDCHIRVGDQLGAMAHVHQLHGGLPEMKHTCHWPGCQVEVPPKMWGCKRHWFTLPKQMRDRIWQEYRPGQENDKRPSDKYLEIAQRVHDWCLGYEAGKRSASK